MRSAPIRLSAASFALAFPFHIAFDRELTVIAVGPVLSRILPSIRVGARASECLRWKRPSFCPDIAAIRDLARGIVVLETTEGVVLRGQLIVQDDDGDGEGPIVLFLGSPRLSSVSSLAAMGLSISDYAIHDSASDLLFLLQVRETTLADAQRIASELDRQRAELRRANTRLAAQFVVTQILTEAADLEEAMLGVTAAVGEALNYEVGGFWAVDHEADVIRCVHIWNPLAPLFEDLAQTVKALKFPRGAGLLTKAWTDRGAFFGSEVELGPFGVRAKNEGLLHSLAFPVMGARDVVGVMGFWARAETIEDEELKRFVMDSGEKVGQFIEHRRAELEIRRAREELSRQLEVMESQAAAIRSLSTPILRVADGVLALPVIGVLDRERVDQITERLLGEIWRSRSGVAVIDVTGVVGATAETAGLLLRVIEAVRLLGSECLVAGVSPAMAAGLVDVDEAASLSGMVFFADLKSALADVFRRRGGRIAAKG